MALLIRPFEERDEAAVIALWRAAFTGATARNDPLTIIRKKRAVMPELFLVGQTEGRVIATVIAGYDGHRGWVYHVAVATDTRRKGYGRSMMAAAEERLRALGCPKLNLQVNRWNAEVVAFYEALGYAVEDRISMGKVLQ